MSAREKKTDKISNKEFQQLSENRVHFFRRQDQEVCETIGFFQNKNQKCFFRAHRTNDLTKKLEKVGPFECDELEKHCRVSAKCYPIKVIALYTMAKENFNALFLVLLLVSRQSKNQLLVINELVPIVYIISVQ